MDIIGIIDDISDKKVYNSGNKEGGERDNKDNKEREKDKEKEKDKDKREVVRITVRNKFKSVQINFWA